jgi:hypothetical protein
MKETFHIKISTTKSILFSSIFESLVERPRFVKIYECRQCGKQSMNFLLQIIFPKNKYLKKKSNKKE